MLMMHTGHGNDAFLFCTIACTMGRKKTNYNELDAAWGFYLEDQRPRTILRKCTEAGFSLHRNKLSRWINNGIPSKKIEAFKDRLARIKATAIEIVEDSTEAQEETVDHQTAAELSDNILIKYAAMRLDQWRSRMNDQLVLATIANDKIQEMLMGVDPEDTTAMKNAMTAWKNAVGAQTGIIGNHSVLQDIGGEEKEDDRDKWIQENFEDWSPEEHAAFRDHGVWPDRLGAPPEFTLIPDPDSQEDSEEPEPEEEDL